MLLPTLDLGNEPSHSTSRKMLDSLGEYTFVNWGSVERSFIPLASFGFFDCSALAAFYGDCSGSLAHVKHDYCVPDRVLLEQYLEKLVDSSNSTCFVAANSESRIELIVRTAGERGAKIGGSFIFSDHVGPKPKDIIVFPHIRQVRIYSTMGVEIRTV